MNKRRIPVGWEWESGRASGHYTHHGYAMNSKQWLKPAIWTVNVDEKKRVARVRCYWGYYVNNNSDAYSHVSAALTIVGDSLTVEKGPWEIPSRPGETPLSAGIRWVQQQENAAKQLGSV